MFRAITIVLREVLPPPLPGFLFLIFIILLIHFGRRWKSYVRKLKMKKIKLGNLKEEWLRKILIFRSRKDSFIQILDHMLRRDFSSIIVFTDDVKKVKELMDIGFMISSPFPVRLHKEVIDLMCELGRYRFDEFPKKYLIPAEHDLIERLLYEFSGDSIESLAEYVSSKAETSTSLQAVAFSDFCKKLLDSELFKHEQGIEMSSTGKIVLDLSCLDDDLKSFYTLNVIKSIQELQRDSKILFIIADEFIPRRKEICDFLFNLDASIILVASNVTHGDRDIIGKWLTFIDDESAHRIELRNLQIIPPQEIDLLPERCFIALTPRGRFLIPFKRRLKVKMMHFEDEAYSIIQGTKILIEGRDFYPLLSCLIHWLKDCRLILFLDCSSDFHELRRIEDLFDIIRLDLNDSSIFDYEYSGFVSASAHGIEVEKLNNVIDRLKVDACIVLHASTPHLNLRVKNLILQTDERDELIRKNVDSVISPSKDLPIMGFHVEERQLLDEFGEDAELARNILTSVEKADGKLLYKELLSKSFELGTSADKVADIFSRMQKLGYVKTESRILPTKHGSVMESVCLLEDKGRALIKSETKLHPKFLPKHEKHVLDKMKEENLL